MHNFNLFFNTIEILTTTCLLIFITIILSFLIIFKITKNKKRIPTIVCLCGSMKFKDAYKMVEETETLVGKIVLTSHVNKTNLTYIEQIKLNELHKRKIDLCDEIFILDINEYIGDSTMDELKYAQRKRKYIRFFSKEKGYKL